MKNMIMKLLKNQMISVFQEEKDDSNSEDEYLFEYDELDEKYEELLDDHV